MSIASEIKKRKAKIEELEYELRVQRDVVAALSAVTNDEQATTSSEPRPIIPDSIVAPIQSVLQAAEKPMKVKELLKLIKQQGFQFEGRTDPKRLISSALNRRTDLFQRVDRGLYELRSKTAETTENRS